MAKSGKKAVREAFRNAVFKRDDYRCVMCGKRDGTLDAHHICDRTQIINGGYVKENGITLCSGDDKTDCHWKAEVYHSTGTAYPGYSPEDLYAKIGSSFEKACRTSEKLT